MNYPNVFRASRVWPIPLMACLALATACASDDSGDDAAGATGSGASAGAGGSSASGGSSGSGGASASGGAGGSSGAGGSASGSGGTAGSTTENLHGSVVVSLVPPVDDKAGYSTFLGRFFDGPTPPTPTSILELDSTEGDCELWAALHPFCTDCPTPGVCAAEEMCVTPPTPVSVGTLTVEGLGETMALEPRTTVFQ
jgi:hypothetical protein